jgi:prepilin-type processing-associated H-X9-DG protein
MPSHAVGEAYWPLGPENNTGVGLWWRNSMAQWDFLTNFVSLTKTQGADTNTELITVKMPAITRDMIHAPATTLLLTEHAIPQNTAFAASGSTIAGPTDHLDKNAIPADRYHGGKIEYLMVDGHVELLFPLESTGQRDPRDASDKPLPNLWTIRPDD